MESTKQKATTLTNIDPEMHLAIKLEAVRRGIAVNEMYLKVISSGAKRLKIVNESD